MDNPTLQELGDDELIATGRELARITHDVPYPRPAQWAGYQAFLVMNETLRRVGEGPLPMPDYPEGIRTLSDLAPRELRRLHDRLSMVAALEGADGEDSAVARWWAHHCRRVAATLDARDSDAEPLRRWIAARRTERPHGSPGDTTGIPPWSEASRQDES